MALLSVNDLKTHVDQEIVSKTIRLMDWELGVRRIHDPVDAENTVARLEEKIRRILSNGPKTDRDLKRYTHCKQDGLWFYNMAKQNLENCREINFDRQSRQYFLAESA
jgi:NADH dehydrogenase/NADH:ubiquinone oxidoreductase subunit G